MATIASLNIALTADSAKLKRDLDKANKSTSAFAKRQKKHMAMATSAAKKLAGAIAGIGAAALALRGMSQLSKELIVLSNLTGLSTTEIQQLDPALNSINMSTEKYADILKDVNDKMHDFLQTGGGPMKDFFEQIAPKVGITADAFKNLSGKDALQLYVDSLEKAGASQEQMTFYMEAIASDSTMLLPLLRNASAEMLRFGLAADQVIKPEVLADLKNLGVQIAAIGVIVRNSITNAFGPLIAILADSAEGWRLMISEFPAVLKGLGLITAAIGLLTAYMLMNPILAIVAGFIALVVAAGNLFKKLHMLKEATGSWASTFSLLGKAFGHEMTRMMAYGTKFGLFMQEIWNDIARDFEYMLYGINVSFAKTMDALAGSSLGRKLGLEGGNNDAVQAAHEAAEDASLEEFLRIKAAQEVNQAVIDSVNPFAKKIADILTPVTDVVDDITDAAKPSTLSSPGGLKTPKGADKDTPGDVFVDSLKSSFTQALKDGDWKSFLGSVMDSFTSTVIDSFVDGLFEPLEDIISDAMDALISSISKSASGGGGGNWISSAISWIGGLFGAADGGIVPTTPFSKSYADSVPTMLQPGELVVPKDQVGNFMGGGSGGGQTFNINVTGDISRLTRKEVVKMMPEIAAGTNMVNRENNVRG